MIEYYGATDGSLRPIPCARNAVPAGAVWVDILDPTPDDERDIESRFGVDVPTPEEMAEIESTSRLYESDGALYMTAVLICGSETENPRTTAITFILTPERLFTVRYDTPQSFRIFLQRCERGLVPIRSGRDALVGLLGTIVDRAADILERVGSGLEGLTREIFRQSGAKARPRSRQPRNLQQIIEEVGSSHDVVFRIRESLTSLERLLLFLRGAPGTPDDSDFARRVAGLDADLRSLEEYASFLSNKVDFMLEATLGLVGIQQNGIIKIFSVVAVIFMPPTLVASIYGMNFAYMPELEWLLGYPWALGLMAGSAAVTYLFFKLRRWL